MGRDGKSSGSSDDAALVERILADPTAGWADAWNLYGHRLHTYCRRLVDNPNEADDAVADVFLLASQRIEGLRKPEAFGAWMFAIARRRIQDTWRERQRTVPVDPHSDTTMSAATTDRDLTGASDAAELIAAASDGLSDKDRDLLALALGSDLDTGEMAQVTGKSVASISLRVNRLKDRVGRAAGALLVARHHRRDCDVLADLLAEWDGIFDATWRNRIARHVDRCDECSRRRKAATAVFAAPLLFAPPSEALRERVLQPISTSHDIGSDDWTWDDDGFPGTGGAARKLLAVAGVAAAIAIVIALVLGVAGNSPDDRNALVLAAGSSAPVSTTTSTTAPTTTAAVTTSTTAPTTTVAASPPITAGSTSTSTTVDSTDTSDTTATTDTTSTTLPGRPTVELSLSKSSIWIGGETSTATIAIDAPGGATTTELSWDGPEGGSVSFQGEGPHVFDIGPFDSAPPSTNGSGAVTVTATVTDAFGQQASTSAALVIQTLI